MECGIFAMGIHMGKRREQKYLTEDEIEVLKAACEAFSDQLIVYGLLYTGMRVEKLCHLKPSHSSSVKRKTVR